MTEDISFQSTNGGRGNTPWLNDPTNVGGGQAIEFRYFGTGDTGGGPTEQSVQIVQKALTAPPEGLVVKNTSPDQLAKDLTPEQRATLPVYNDELILKTHGTGCYTSQAAMKRFNRANELLADAAEKAGVSAMVLAGQPYPTERLRDAWIRFLWHQFHDDLTGTCIPQAYQFSWNDEIASLNQFAGVLTSSTSAVSSLLDTSGAGTPIVVYNPVSMNRTRAGRGDAESRAAGDRGDRRRREHGCDRAGAGAERHRRAARPSRSRPTCRRWASRCITCGRWPRPRRRPRRSRSRPRRSRTTASA